MKKTPSPIFSMLIALNCFAMGGCVHQQTTVRGPQPTAATQGTRYKHVLVVHNRHHPLPRIERKSIPL